MAADPLLLGLDLGSSSFKAQLIDPGGHECGQATEPAPFRAGEMPVADLVAAAGRLCQQLDPAQRRRVAGVGVAGLAESGAPLDRHGAALAPVIAWYDPRGAEVVDRLQARCGPDLNRALGQQLRVVSAVAKLGWLVDQGTVRVWCWLGVPELVLHALTGSVATEFSLAARTGAYHVGERRWLGEVIEELGVAGADAGGGAGAFPPVRAAGADMGRVTRAAAGWSGLPAGVPVTVAGHDHLVGWVGAGVGPGEVANSVGTAETVVSGVASWPDVDRALAERVAVTVVPGGKGWALLTSAVRSGVVIAAVSRALGGSPGELDRCAGMAQDWVRVSDDVVAAAASGGPVRAAGAPLATADGPLATAGGPVPAGGGPLRAGRAAGVLPEGPAGAVWGGLLEALSGRTWAAVDRLGLLLPAPPEGLVVFGGGSVSRVWMQAKARVRPAVPVWRCETADTVGRGAALYGGVAAGWWSGRSDFPPTGRVLVEAPCRPKT